MQTKQVIAVVVLIAILAIALGTAIGYNISSARTTTFLTTQTITPTPNTVTLTQFFTSTATSNMTVTQITTLPPNEVVTKVIIFQDFILYPVIISTNCSIQNAPTLVSTSVTKMSYIATTTGSIGTTVTIYDHTTQTISPFYEYADSNLTISTYTTAIGNSTVTTTVCETIS